MKKHRYRVRTTQESRVIEAHRMWIDPQGNLQFLEVSECPEPARDPYYLWMGDRTSAEYETRTPFLFASGVWCSVEQLSDDDE